MFSSMMKYRFLCQLRSKESIFWILLFPIILSVLFYAALSDITKGETFEAVHIAVADDEGYGKEIVMSEIISAVSTSSEESVTDNKLFITDYVSKAEAEKMLEEDKVSAYVYFDGECNVIMKENGMSQTIVKKFFDIAKQKESVITAIMTENGGVIPDNISEIMNDSTEYIKDISNRRNEPDTAVQFFYSILGMACMYGATTGCVAMRYLQTNQSSIAERNSVAPISKLKQLLSFFIVDMLMNDVIVLAVLAFIRFALGVNFGDRYGLIILTAIVGGTMGLSFGYFFGSITKKDLNFKNNMVMGISMICSFLAGMMSNKVKYVVEQHAPLIGRINPVNLVTESYYKLYYYTDLGKYYENIFILIIMTALFIIGTVSIINMQERNLLKERS